MQRFACEIDTVTVKGSAQPLKLFTVRIDDSGFQESREWLKRLNTRERITMREIEKRKMSMRMGGGGKAAMWRMISNDADMVQLRRRFNKDMEEVFRRAYRYYLQGKWTAAEELLDYCLRMEPNDGPARTLRNYIVQLNGIPPNAWRGYRELEEK